MSRYLIAAALMVAIVMPTVAEEDPRSIVAAIDAEYDKVFVAHDAERLVALYSDDATVLPPTLPAATGSEAVLGFWRTSLKGNYTTHNFQIVSATFLADNTILATNHWSADLTDASGKVTPFHGDGVQILVKTNQGWKIRLASWNSLK
jgi:ketosteroid isomerase-like protein